MNSKSIFNGLKWASIELAFDSIIKFSLKLLLAKLLLPEDFGLLGMCMVFIGITQAISQLGIGAALIQRKDDQDVVLMYNTAFWTNIVLGSILYLFLSVILGPMIAWFYEEPILKTIIPVLSLSVIIQPFSLIPKTILTRKLDFKRLSKAYNLSSLVSSIIAVTLAFYGFGVWALVMDFILSSSFSIPILIFFTKWTPKLEWKKNYFHQIFGFGVYTTGTSIIRSIANSVDYLIIGKLLGSTLLGSYTLAFMLSNQLRSFLSRIINKVMYPVFSKFQHEGERLKSFFLTILKINALMIYPLMAFLIYFGKEVVLIFFGEKWIDSIIPLQILAFAMLIDLLGNAIDSILRAKGKPKLELKILSFVNLSVLVPGLFIGVYFYSLTGAAIAVLVNTITYVITCIIALKKEINLKPIETIIAVRSPCVGIIMSMIMAYVLNFIVKDINFYLSAFSFIITYAVTIYFLEIKYLKQILKKYI